MLYMSAEGEFGLCVFLGIGDENITRIAADDPLVARLSYIGHPGFFILFISEDGNDSPRMAALRQSADTALANYFAMPCTAEELVALKTNQGFFTVEPRDRLPGIERISVLYCNDPKSMVKSLRDKGMIGEKTEMRVIPRSPTDN
jgi:hypothetical protein